MQSLARVGRGIRAVLAILLLIFLIPVYVVGWVAGIMWRALRLGWESDPIISPALDDIEAGCKAVERSLSKAAGER